jgi:Alternative complex III, ActD subunit
MATRMVPGVLAAFKHLDAACDAISALRAQGRKDFTVYSASPNHEIEHALGIENSPVRLFTLIGGITGVLAGVGMTFWMSLDWPLLVGGKPIATFPPYVVFMFELMVLLGALSTVAGIVILSLTRRTTGLAYDPSFSDDRIGIFIPCGAADAPGVERMMRDAGSVEVRHAA